MTIIRILAASGFALVLGSVPAQAQGRSAQQVVISPVVVKSMTAHRQKSKTPLTARVGMHRAPAATVVTTESAHTAPTSVRAIKKAPIAK